MQVRRPIPWISGSLATLVAIWVVSQRIPKTGQVIFGDGNPPTDAYFQPEPWKVSYILAIAFIPVLSIFILGQRGKLFEWLSWAVLVVLLINLLKQEF